MTIKIEIIQMSSENTSENAEQKKNTQNHWIYGLCPLSGILNTIKCNVLEIGSVSILRWGGGVISSVGSLRKS
jgi:hypothetical protein